MDENADENENFFGEGRLYFIETILEFAFISSALKMISLLFID